MRDILRWRTRIKDREAYDISLDLALLLAVISHELADRGDPCRSAVEIGASRISMLTQRSEGQIELLMSNSDDLTS